MRKILLIGLFILSINGFIKSQTMVYNDISLVVNPTNYTVTANYDTTYVREVVINMNDTVGFQSLSVQLYENTDNGWVNVGSVNLNKPSNYSPCSVPLCLYQKSFSQWVLFVGNYSLNSRHRLELHFSTQFTNTNNTDWVQEF